MFKTATASELVTKGQCTILQIFVSSPDGTIGQIDVYDGMSNSGKLIATVKAPAGASGFLKFTQPQQIDVGIFVNVVAAVVAWSLEFNV